MEKAVKQVLKGTNKMGMITYMEDHPEEFTNLIELALTNEQPYAWRAAWLLSKCMDDNDPRVQPYLTKILEILPTVKEGQMRDLFNVFYRMELEEELEGRLFDFCVNVWCKLDHIPSVRSNALKLILQTTERVPELYQEVVLLTQDEFLDPLSHGIRRSVQKRMKAFAKKYGQS